MFVEKVPKKYFSDVTIAIGTMQFIRNVQNPRIKKKFEIEYNLRFTIIKRKCGERSHSHNSFESEFRFLQSLVLLWKRLTLNDILSPNLVWFFQTGFKILLETHQAGTSVNFWISGEIPYTQKLLLLQMDVSYWHQTWKTVDLTRKHVDT